MKTIPYLLLALLVQAPIAAQQWVPLGPITPAAGLLANGQVNCLAFDPGNPSRMYAGGPAGGLWTSSDGGGTWLPMGTDTFTTIGVSDIIVNPADANNIIVACGDRDEGSSGIMPSTSPLFQTTDGGITWRGASTLLAPVFLSRHIVSRVIQNPSAPATFLAAASVGLFSTTSFYTTWVMSSTTGVAMDLKFKPGDFSIIYASIAGRAWRSTNSGVSFTQMTLSVPSTVYGRIQFAVSAAAPSTVYALCSNSDGSFNALFRSTDNGSSWSQRSASPNILGAALDGSSVGGNGLIALSLAVSPLNSNIIFAGGTNVWRSMDGGATWSIVSHFSGFGAPFVSAEIHDLKFAPAPKSYVVYAATGNGVFTTSDTGRSWTCVSTGLQLAQINHIASHPSNDSLILAATPVATLRFSNGAWTKISDTASLGVFFHPTQPNTAFLATASGRLFKSADTGVSFLSDISPPGAPVGTALIPYAFNPKNYGNIYAALRDLWRTTNGGGTWQRTLNSFGADIKTIVISPGDTSTVYILTAAGKLWRSTSAGVVWDSVRTIEFQVAAIATNIYAHPADASKLLAISGKYFSLSTNGGASWVKLTLNRDYNISSAYWKYDNCGESIYLGTNQGIWEVNDQSQFGIPTQVGSGIPNSPPNYTKLSGRYLRAATAGRGLWQAFIDKVGVVADFAQDKLQVCPGEYVQFYDKTKYGGVGWEWSFENGNPPKSSDQSPVVLFDIPGVHNVQLVAINSCGRDTLIRKSVTVIPKLRALIGFNRTTVCLGDTIRVTDQTAGGGGSRVWTVTGAKVRDTVPGAVNVVCDQTGKISIQLQASNVCGTSTENKTISVIDAPRKQKIALRLDTTAKHNDTLAVADSTGMSYQWYVNNAAITGATSSLIVPVFSADYYVRVSNAGGCIVSSDTFSFVKRKDTSSTKVEYEDFAFLLSPNPVYSELTLRIPYDGNDKVELVLRDALGAERRSWLAFPDASGIVKLQLEELAAGNYLLELRSGARIRVARFVKI